MFKQSLIIVSLFSLLMTGCSSDLSSQREVDGNQNYLKSPELKPLIVPESVSVPTASNQYYVFKAAADGNVGKDIDIRPPSLALPTIADSYAVYQSGLIQLDVPNYVGFWSQIPTILRNNNIAIKSEDSSTIKTDIRLVNRINEEQPVEASYLLQRKISGDREYITVELASLKRMGADVSSPIERQYYTVEFFNMLMKAVSPSQSQAGN